MPADINDLVKNAPTAADSRALPYLKAVDGLGYFQKQRTIQQGAPLLGTALSFTYCDVTDYGGRPFGNLLAALGLPIAPADRASLGQAVAGTALDGLQNLEKVVVAEIPAGAYGELLDGKSLELRVPITSGGVTSVYTLYGGYYGFSPDLNNQVSDVNTVSGRLGVAPTPDNDFNSNVAYLFSNEVQRPNDTATTVPLKQGLVNVPARGSLVVPLALAAGLSYSCNAAAAGSGLRVMVLVPNLGELALTDAVLNGQISANGFFRLRYAVTEIHLYNDGYAAMGLSLNVSRYDVASARSWSTWTPTNRYPLLPGGVGKVVAALRDPTQQGLLDAPVGVVYLDKGLVVLTHPLLVAGLSRVGARLIDPVTPGATLPCPAAPAPFTRLCYPADDGTLARLLYSSVTTEYTQTFTCMASIGEFTKTTNPTYALAYPDAAGNEPVFITEVGLYNASGELMALAKTSQPVVKTASSPSLFTLTLRA